MSESRLVCAHFPTAGGARRRQEQPRNFGVSIVTPAPPAASRELAPHAGAERWKTAGSSTQREALKANEVQRAKAWRLSHGLSKQSRLQASPANPSTQPLEEPCRSRRALPRLLGPYRGGTYGDHGHGDAHGRERRVGHRAALIG